MARVPDVIDMNKINKRLARSNRAALEFVSNDMLGDDYGGITQYVPKKTGALRRSGTTEFKITNRDASGNATGGEIYFSWYRPISLPDGYDQSLGEGDYVVSMLYQGLNPIKNTDIQNWTTAGTGPDWVQEAFNDLHEEWAKQYAESFTQQFRA